jgi:hypothetical protein
MSFRLLAAHHENLTISVSMLAFAVSLFSLGWNVHRDVIFKPRLRIRFSIAHLASGDELVIFHLTVVNLGPGTAVVEAMAVKTQLATLIWSDGSHVVGVPKELKAGQRTVLVVHPRESLLEQQTKALRIGVQDAFGRIHWAPRKVLKNVHSEYAERKAKSASVHQNG